MKKVNWNKLVKKIPKSFKLGKRNFKIIWVKGFEDKKQVGESDWNNRVIYLKKNQTNKEKVLTYLHEVTHIYSDEFDIKISEKQVQKIEKNLHFLLLKGNIFK